jgi:hypothetical protein
MMNHLLRCILFIDQGPIKTIKKYLEVNSLPLKLIHDMELRCDPCYQPHLVGYSSVMITKYNMVNVALSLAVFILIGTCSFSIYTLLLVEKFYFTF